MKHESSTDRYGRLSIIMHWSMVILFIGIYACIELRGALPKGHVLKGPLLGFHGLLGLAVFALVWVRLLGRLTPRPPIRPQPTAWQNAVAKLMHLALYGLVPLDCPRLRGHVERLSALPYVAASRPR